jgi:hypothetical protein
MSVEKTDLGNVVSVIDGKPVRLSVRAEPIGPSSSDLSGEIPLAYYFAYSGSQTSPRKQAVIVKITDDLIRFHFNNKDRQLHDAAIRFGLASMKTDPNGDTFTLNPDTYKAFISERRLDFDFFPERAVLKRR